VGQGLGHDHQGADQRPRRVLSNNPSLQAVRAGSAASPISVQLWQVLPGYAKRPEVSLRGGPGAQDLQRPGCLLEPPLSGQRPGGRSFYGYKLHRAVCAETSLPLAWRMETAKAAESSFTVPLLMR
jgi:hypothetical protein